jgi:hypothetical protein
MSLENNRLQNIIHKNRLERAQITGARLRLLVKSNQPSKSRKISSSMSQHSNYVRACSHPRTRVSNQIQTNTKNEKDRKRTWIAASNFM